jgi:hypothetical protein
LLADNAVYNITLDTGRILNIDTSFASQSNYIIVTYNNSNTILNADSPYIEIEYDSNVWKKIQVTAFGSASLEAFSLTNIDYQQDDLNNYLVTNEDEFVCIANEGYNYHVTNAPTDFMKANYIQKSNLNFLNHSNIMIESTFKGVYDGNNLTLNNLNYMNTSTDTSNYALFKSIDSATLKNITLSNNLNVYGETSNDPAFINFGGLVFETSNNCLIENCKINGSGKININGSVGLICNNIKGSNNIIVNCSTKYIGDIITTNTIDASGIILGYSLNSNNSVLYCSNENIGNVFLGSTCGGLVGSNVDIILSTNRMIGNLNGTTSGTNINIGGIIGIGNAYGCINSMIGNMFNSNQLTLQSGGIIGYGIASNCINCMIGNIEGNNSNGSIGGNFSSISNCLNVMKGNTRKAIGGLNTLNNICGMYGKPNTTESNNNNYGLSNYGLDNSISQLQIINSDNIESYLPTNIYYKYLPNNYYFKFPYVQSSNYIINNTTFENNQKMYTMYPNVEGNIDLNTSSTNFNLFAIRSTDNQLVKLTINSTDYINLGTLIFNYCGKVYTFDFSWENEITLNNNLKIGIGTNNPLKTLDINGDMGLTGNLFYNYIEQGLWYDNSNKLLFNESNNIGIGKSNNIDYKLDIEGTIRANSYLTTSDIRLKKNIQNENLSLDFIRNLQPKTFNFINDNKIRHGFIAQEILNSDFINSDNNGYLSIKIENLISPIIKALQEINYKYQ